MSALSGLFDWIRHLAAVVKALVIPLLIAGMMALVLALPGQMHELYRLVVEDTFSNKPDLAEASRRIAVVSVAMLLAAAWSIAFVTRAFAATRCETLPFHLPFWRWLLRWMPAMLTASVFLGLAYGLRQASIVEKTGDAAEILRQLTAAGYVNSAQGFAALVAWTEKGSSFLGIASFTALGLALAVFPMSVLARRLTGGDPTYATFRTPAAAIATTIAIGAVVVIIADDPVTVPRWAGSIALFAAFVFCLSLATGQIAIWSQHSRLPLIPILACAALVFSLADLNDNHELRRIDRNGQHIALPRNAAPARAELPSLEAGFLEWVRTRTADGVPSGRRFPVYVVAAQGGGIYAATHTLTFLTAMQASCERFAQHLFAISGVSGGSVGAALYSAIADTFERTKAECPRIGALEPGTSPSVRAAIHAMNRLMTEDYLSPLVGAALFPDFLQRFWFMPVSEWSRARALEKGLEASFESAMKSAGGSAAAGKAIATGVAASWDPKRLRPALLLNTTETASGRRRVIAPFSIKESSDYDLRQLPASRDYDIPLSSAAVASARFPWLTPAAWFWGQRANKGMVKTRVVDGGYFENSGVATAVDLVEALQQIARQHALPVDIHLIALTSGGFPEATFEGLAELISPVVSLLNTRQARTASTVDLADRQLGPIDPSATGERAALARIKRLQKVEIRNLLTPLPLGWQLSAASAFQIYQQRGLIRNCSPNDHFEQARKGGAFTSADCVKLLIYHQLRGDDLGQALVDARKRAPR